MKGFHLSLQRKTFSLLTRYKTCATGAFICFVNFVFLGVYGKMMGWHETHEQRWRISACIILGSSANGRRKVTEDHDPFSRRSLLCFRTECACQPVRATLLPWAIHVYRSNGY
ncbi:hypothetical protein LY76DRAFT_103090 [Colletotrichum caudatum]|nr:hypothetical protein LY76DRAFT_103090 [Colletotrichum caudatum]